MQKSSGGIGFLAGGLVFEDEEELGAFDDRNQAVVLTGESKLSIAGSGILFGFTKNVGDGKFVRRIVRNPLCFDAVFIANRVPVEAGEGLAVFAAFILEADGVAGATMNDEESEIVELD